MRGVSRSRSELLHPIAAVERTSLAWDRTGIGLAGLGALLVKLPDWLYPVVCNTTTGEVAFDNYNQAWGRQEHLDRCLQGYAIEKARIEARKRGHTVVEQPLADGSVKLTITVGGAS